MATLVVIGMTLVSFVLAAQVWSETGRGATCRNRLLVATVLFAAALVIGWAGGVGEKAVRELMHSLATASPSLVVQAIAFLLFVGTPVAICGAARDLRRR